MRIVDLLRAQTVGRLFVVLKNWRVRAARVGAGLYELSASGNRVIPMEGLRGLAVLLVFFVHFHALFGEYIRAQRLLWESSRFLGLIGNTGVDLFFVLSGYLIYGALLKSKTAVLPFLRRRVQRIYPTFLAVFGVYIALSLNFPSLGRLHNRSTGNLVCYLAANLLLLPGAFDIKPIITVAWSLSYEVVFYISATLGIRAAGMERWTARQRLGLFSTIALIYLFYCFMLPKSHVRSLMFIVGVLLYDALGSPAFRRLLTKRGEMLAIIMFCGSLAVSYLLDINSGLLSLLPRSSSGRSVIPGAPGYYGPYKTLLLAISIFWFTAHCFAFPGRLNRLFSWNPLRYLGNMSYSYYLIHGVTLQGIALLWALAAGHQAGTWLFLLALAIGFPATWIISTALFLSVERPLSLQRVGAQHASNSRVGVLAVAAPAEAQGEQS